MTALTVSRTSRVLIRAATLAWIATASALAGAGATPQPEAPLRLTGSGPYYQLALPQAWQRHSARDDLGDLRVLNAAGDALPYAWIDVPDGASVEQRTSLPLFRWDGPAMPPVKASAPPMPSPTSPSWPIWVADLRAIPGAVRSLQLSLPEQQRGIFALAVEVSPDMQTWTTVKDQSQVAVLEHDGLTLRQDVIELNGIQARYLRLRLLPGSPLPAFTGMEVLSTRDVALTPAWSWSEPIAPSQCSPQACDYPVPPHLLLQRLKVNLTEANTLLDLQVQSRTFAQTRVLTRPHHLHDRLHALRHKSRAEQAEDMAGARTGDWSSIAEGEVHWIERPDAQMRAEELALPAARHQMLRLRAAGGGDAGWTRHPPAIQVGTWSRALVFLARGAQPYRIGWGDASAPPVALSMSTLMPKAAVQAQPGPGLAVLDTTAGNLGQPVDKRATAPPAMASDEQGRWLGLPRAWVLWAALLLGLGVMAFMARSLLNPDKIKD